MKYLVTLFWAFAIGQAVCYLGGALQSASYNFELSTIISLINCIRFFLILKIFLYYSIKMFQCQAFHRISKQHNVKRDGYKILERQAW